MADDEQNRGEANPFESADAGFDPSQPIDNGEQIEQELPKGTPEVAAKAGKTFIILGIVGVVALFLLYQIFGESKPEVKTEPNVRKIDSQPIEPPPLPTAAPELSPPLPSIVPPPLPTPVDIPVISEAVNPMNPEAETATREQANNRIRSNMMVKSGGGSGITGALTGGGANSGATDPNSVFGAAAGSTPVAKVKATRISEMTRTIAQGRIIHATLETALNTDLPAPIRAIVSRDTYGEAGMVPLIPKGSRLIGQYNTSLLAGQTRVFVIWTRIIRPDGVDIMVGSPGVDQIGQAGFSGQVDSKFQQTFARAFVASIMNIGLAIGSDEITGGTTTTTQPAQGGTQTTGDAATEATSEALDKLGTVTDTFLQRFMSIQPTILVDQGTPVNVLVNKDLIFPSDIDGVNVVD